MDLGIIIYIILVIFLILIIFKFTCKCGNGNGFSVGVAPPIQCDPKANPPEICPGGGVGTPCPQCGKPACFCPTPPPGPKLCNGIPCINGSCINGSCICKPGYTKTAKSCKPRTTNIKIENNTGISQYFFLIMKDDSKKDNITIANKKIDLHRSSYQPPKYFLYEFGPVNNSSDISISVPITSSINSGKIWTSLGNTNPINKDFLDIAKGSQAGQEMIEITMNYNNIFKISFDISFVDGITYGLTYNYTNQNGSSIISASCMPTKKPDYPTKQMINRIKNYPNASATSYLSDKHFKDQSGILDELTGCPAKLATTYYGMHKCRSYYAYQRNKSAHPTYDTYCSWLKDSTCSGYCWAMEEFTCTNLNCGWNNGAYVVSDREIEKFKKMDSDDLRDIYDFYGFTKEIYMENMHFKELYSSDYLTPKSLILFKIWINGNHKNINPSSDINRNWPDWNAGNVKNIFKNTPSNAIIASCGRSPATTADNKDTYWTPGNFGCKQTQIGSVPTQPTVSNDGGTLTFTYKKLIMQT